MSDFSKSIIRGMGYTIGRNLINGSSRRSSTPTRRAGRPAKSSFDKALEYPIGGRVSTLIGKQFNLIQEFENHIKSGNTINYYASVANAFLQVQEKFNDTSKYINMVGDTSEQNEQSVQMQQMYLDMFVEKIKNMISNLNVNDIDNSNLDNLLDAADKLNIDYDQAKINTLKLESSKLKAKQAKKESTNKVIAGVLWVGILSLLIFSLAA